MDNKYFFMYKVKNNYFLIYKIRFIKFLRGVFNGK